MTSTRRPGEPVAAITAEATWLGSHWAQTNWPSMRSPEMLRVYDARAVPGRPRAALTAVADTSSMLIRPPILTPRATAFEVVTTPRSGLGVTTTDASLDIIEKRPGASKPSALLA